MRGAGRNEKTGPKDNALIIMQDLIKFHLNDSLPDALVHIDLKRLQFVYLNQHGESSDKYYLETLQSLLDQFKSYEASSEISFKIASKASADLCATTKSFPPVSPTILG